MLTFMLNPYILVVVSSILTATLVTLYNRTLESDASKVNRSFFKIAIFGVASGVALVFALNRPDSTPREPFFDDVAAGGIVPSF